MFSYTSFLGALQEALLCCIGSPHSRKRQLKALRNLDAHLLQDIGVTAEEAQQGIAWRIATPEGSPRPPVRLEIRRPSLNR